MPFQLEQTTQVTVTNANPRREFHGDEKVRAIDISGCIVGENTLLDRIQPGLREHHYFNKALTAGQETLPDVVVPLPNLRFPSLPLSYVYTLPGKKVRGYRFIRDYGTREEDIDFSDVALGGIHYEIAEGGSVKVFFTLSYNGEELQDNDLYGMLSGLASEGEIHMKLLAPPELLPAKKGYRAGKPDTPPAADKDGAQGELGQEGTGAAGGEDEETESDAGNDATTGEPLTAEEVFANDSKPAVTH
jgi:hypothetical protein